MMGASSAPRPHPAPSSEAYTGGAGYSGRMAYEAPDGAASATAGGGSGYAASSGAAVAAGTSDGPAKTETAAEKLARLRAKQAARVGGAYLTGSVGGDYSSSGGALSPSKGLQRYQQLVRGGK